MDPVNVFMLLTPKASVSFLFSNESASGALEKMHAHTYTSIPVLNDDGSYAGSVSEGDFLWTLADLGWDMERFSKMKVSELIQGGKYPAVRADVGINELTSRVLMQNYAPVIDDRGFFIGIVTRREVMGYLIKKSETKSN